MKTFSSENKELKKFCKIDWKRSYLRESECIFWITIDMVRKFLTGINYVTVVYLAGMRVYNREISLGKLILV